MKSLEALDTVDASQYSAGCDNVIKMMYSDNRKSLLLAYATLGIMRKPAPLGDSHANGLIENLNRRIQEGAQASLIQAGLRICCWSFAVQHWVFLRTTKEEEDGMSPYKFRVGAPFVGERLPFGLGAFYYPNETKQGGKHVHKFQVRLSYGIIVGYQPDPGRAWSGCYFIVNVDKFIYCSRDEFADPRESSAVGQPYATRQIMLEPHGCRFNFSSANVNTIWLSPADEPTTTIVGRPPPRCRVSITASIAASSWSATA